MELHDPATARPACLAVAGVDEQPAQPRLEPVGFADRPDMDPGRQQGILDGVRREVIVAQDQAGRPEELGE